MREALDWRFVFACYHPPGYGLHGEEPGVEAIDQTPAADHRDEPGTRADGRRQEQAVEREAHGIQQGVL